MSRALPLLLLAACAVDPAASTDAPLPPPAPLTLQVSPAVPGYLVRVQVFGVEPDERVALAVSDDTTSSPSVCPSRLGGLCLDLAPPAMALGATRADAQGVATFYRHLPAGTPMSAPLVFQAAVVRGPHGTLSAATDAVATTVREAPAIAGDWSDEWGTTHHITPATWDQGWATFDIASYDDTTIVARNSPDNAFFANYWSRFDWTWDGGDLYYCQTVYTAYDEADAWAAGAADAGDLASGCVGFSWTLMTP